MTESSEAEAAQKSKVTRVITGVIFTVLLIFLVVLSIGSPIVTIGNEGQSLAYSILVFLPVGAVCVLAVLKSAKAGRVSSMTRRTPGILVGNLAKKTVQPADSNQGKGQPQSADVKESHRAA